MSSLTKEELRAELDKLGVKYHHMHGEAKLQELLSEAQAKEKAIIEDITGVNKPTVEEMVEGGTRTEIGVQRPSGIVIPHQVLATYSKTKFVYGIICDSEHCEVFKQDHRGKKQLVRIYNVDDHGEKFKELAEMFARKNNV